MDILFKREKKMKNLKNIINLVSKKCNLDIKRDDKNLIDPYWLLEAIVKETQEVKEEIEPNNRAHLEDELGDILWGWLALVENLKREGFVGNHEDIFRRTLKKYEERIEPLEGTMKDYEHWQEVKIKQKKALEKEKEMINFRDKVREYYKPYYENSDKAHLIDHPDDVCDLALRINKEYNEKLVILASYLHDMFNREARDVHQKLAYEYVLKSEDKFLNQLSKEERLLVAHAVLEHRGSFKGKFFSKLSAIISSADRGLPDLDYIVRRSMNFNNANANDVYDHIKDKYGTEGYAKYPDVYREIFSNELRAFKKLADEITVEKVLEIWNN